MTTTIERNGDFLVVTKDDLQRTTKTIFFGYTPVVLFDADVLFERRLAVIELLERNICNSRIAAELVGFHRNTVLNLLRTKRLLVIEAACKDERCCKQPYKFIGEIRLHIKKLICTHPDWSDQKIADRSALDLKMEMFRSIVSRIRNEKLNKNVKLPDKKELMERAALAEPDSG